MRELGELGYRGMSYYQASREAAHLLVTASESGRWWDVPEKLIELREIMKRRKDDPL